ncbi:Uncharacterised protein (plasmid) [Tsukamurella tyrosinosolvens]|uniref:Uncharacterized protein n=1 Tax=Tsukamurella tyrosinosolvens TaxID=57704 RepID=A0A1H4LH49_TSUTY|nr:hypothetical protein [Tsukamurella tyrosinosolvens]KXO96611.1 hypothetical protein AXK58_04775 [Tsukamurella tyrosinosolvens]SEB69898.1 hypothetical protein SAMN04489793_0576 [Tsukamurella tyrosinosolvens]VEH93490.1 Uncharacterised protein [Tsukamurella tyrosinosolvens]
MIDRPDTPHADVLLEGIWEDEVTPDDLASRALSAAQASSYAFRVASEGTTATAQLGEVDVAEFLESETGKWAQSFIGIVRVGESLVHVSHALGELARSLQQVNLEQSEIVYQVEAEIEAAERQSAQAGVDPADRIAELIAGARARAAEVAEKMVTPETSSETKKPAAGLVSGFMAFGRVPGASAEATERNGRVARNGHARNGYAIRNTRAEQNGRGATNGHDAVNGRAATNGHEAATGQAANGHDTVEPPAIAETNAAAAAQDAFANSADDTAMDPGFMGFGRTPSTPVPRTDEVATESVVADEAVTDSPIEDAAPETVDEPVTDDAAVDDAAADDAAAEENSEADAPVLRNGFLGLGPAPSLGMPADDVAVPALPQPLVNGFMAFGRTPGADQPTIQGPSSGPIPVAAPTQFLPIPTTPAEIVAGDLGATDGLELGSPMTLSGSADGPSPDRAPHGRADAMDDGFLSFGRVPTGGAWGGSGVLPTVPATAGVTPAGVHDADADEPAVEVDDLDEVQDVAEESDDVVETEALDDAVEDTRPDEPADDALSGDAVDDEAVDDVADLDDEAIDDEAIDDEAIDDGPDDVDFADELDTEADELGEPDEPAHDEPDEDVLDDVLDETESDLDDADGTPSEGDADDAAEDVAAEAEPADGSEAEADDTGIVDTSESEPEPEPEPDGAEADEASDDPEVEVDPTEDATAEIEESAADSDDVEVAEADEHTADEHADEQVQETDAVPADSALEKDEQSETTPEATESGQPEPADAPAAAPAAGENKTAFAAPKPVRKSGPVKFSDLLKAANANKVDPAHIAPAVLVASAEMPVATPEPDPEASAADETGPAAAVSDIPADAAEQPEAPAKQAPVLATGPAILGRTEPLVLRKKVSPAVQQVHDAVASILGSLRGGPHGPESGLHWAAGLLVKDLETIMAVTTSDAGWLPPGVVIPAGVRVLWNMPTGYRWASVDDPVRQLIEYAEQEGYTLTAVATTHPSRAYAPVVGEENIVGVLRPGAVLPGGRSRFEATVSPARLQHIRSLDREQAERQARALIRDLETQPIAPEHAIGIEAARIDARCFLDERDEVPPPVLDQLHTDERALGDALSLDRTPASAEDLTAPAPDAARLRDRMLERAILVATLAAAYHDIESAVYAWTYARFLSSQDQDAPQAR